MVEIINHRPMFYIATLQIFSEETKKNMLSSQSHYYLSSFTSSSTSLRFKVCKVRVFNGGSNSD